MKIAILTHRELPGSLAVNLVAQHLRHHELCLFVSGGHLEPGAPMPPIDAPSIIEPAPDASSDATPSIEALERADQQMERQLDGLDIGLGERRVPLHCLDTLAHRLGTPLQELARPNSSSGLQRLRDARPDLLLSIRYRRILHAEAIAVPTRGVLNWHSGLLPEYQGVMATFWAMRDGNAQIGSTLHYIADRTIDTGPIVARLPIACRHDRTYLDNVLQLYIAGAEDVAAKVEQVARTGAVPTQAQQGRACYFSTPSEDDVRTFIAAGRTLFDGQELDRLPR